MHSYIHRIVITEFLGRSLFELQFDQHVNFVIGPNGSGKTTFIRLLYASLAVDLPELTRLPFSTVEITLASPVTRRRPRLIIKKSQSLRPNRPEITFEIAQGSKIKPTRFRVDMTSPNRYVVYAEDQSGKRQRAPQPYSGRLTVLKAITDLIRFSWLPLTRASTERPSPTDEDPDAEELGPIDKKIADLTNKITALLSSFDKKAADEILNFQIAYFLSLINQSPLAGSAWNPPNIDLSQEKSVLAQIFREMNIGEGTYKDQLDSHFEQAVESFDKFRQRGDAPERSAAAVEYLIVTDTLRLHKLVEKWQEIEIERAKIYKPKTRFIELLNTSYLRKKVHFNDRNRPNITTQGNFPIAMGDLSSGEKQLFILFAETLLQEGQRFVYLADEPELSLHINWQSTLVDNLRILNDQCQLIFATHSPDIVGRYSDKTIDFTETFQ